jgi:choline monooxygenase
MRLAQQSSVTPAHYTSADLFALEQERIFARHWQFVGFADQLAGHQDFITGRLAGRDIVVQNFDGVLKGFRNVCSHRHARIRDADCGNGLLRCPYHGWTYNADGVPVGIPGNSEYFGLDRAARQQLALTAVAVERCGDFVFARLATEGVSLAEHLGEFADRLVMLSHTFTDTIADVRVTWPANWKIAAESTLETYHVDMVHRDSLAQVTPDQPAFVTELCRDHSLGHLDIAEDATKWWRKVARTLKLQRLDQYDGFDHFHIFPNLFIPISYGSLICVQTYEPTAPGECRLRYNLRLAKPAGPQNEEARRVIATSLADFNRLNIEEDIAITSTVQAGAANASSPAMLGLNENRLAHFHQAYLRYLGN